MGRDLYDVNVFDKEYELVMEWMLLETGDMFVEVSFRLKNLKRLKNLQHTNKTREMGITGTGDSKKVFDKIVSSVVKIIKDKNPKYITFHAREENRQNFYKVMTKQILRKIGGSYKSITVSPLTKDVFGNEEFWLEKTV